MNSFELDGILEKKDVIRYTLASVPILDLAIRHMSVVQEAGSDRKLSFSAEAAAVGPAAKALNEVEPFEIQRVSDNIFGAFTQTCPAYNGIRKGVNHGFWCQRKG